MKSCIKCGQSKPLSEFNRNRTMPDGHRDECAMCFRSYNRERYKRPEINAKLKAWRDGRREDKAKYDTEYRDKNFEHLSKIRKDYMQTKAGKLASKQAILAWRKRNPEKRQAESAISNAIRDGHIIRPDKCSRCGVVCKPHGHHESYAYEHRLDVIWVCGPCHREIHKKARP